MQLVTLFRFVEVLVDAPGSATLTFSTDMPGSALAVRATGAIPVTTGRHSFRLSLAGAVKGKLYALAITPNFSSAVAVYAAKVYARVLGPAPSQWAWYSIPVLETPAEWQSIKLPIPQTSDDWQSLKLPIPQTSDDWQSLQLPVKTTPPVPDWIQVPVDA